MNPPASVEDERAFASSLLQGLPCSGSIALCHSPFLRPQKKKTFQALLSTRDSFPPFFSVITCFVACSGKCHLLRLFMRQEFQTFFIRTHRRPSYFDACTRCSFVHPSADLDASGCAMDVRDVPRTRRTRGWHVRTRGGRSRGVYFGMPPRTTPSR